jgi:mRNA-degrading endonuclease RelE of RelBE toxin-antitoxin system
MNDDVDVFEIEYSDDFEANVNRLVKKKKFRKLPDQIGELICDLKKGDFQGTLIRHLDLPVKHDVYKLRLLNKDTNEGKLNGYRVYYSVMLDDKLVLLVTIYYKKETESVSENFIDGLIEGYLLAQSDAENE